MNMNHGTTSSPSSSQSSGPSLSYETIRTEPRDASRPWWVYGVAALYLLLIGAFVTLPAWVNLLGEPDAAELATLAIFVGILTACGLSLMLIPVRTVRGRRVTRRSVWIPIIGSGLLAGTLLMGGGLALAEYLRPEINAFGWKLLAAALLMWAAWSVLFAVMSVWGSGQGVGMILHRWLIAGSVLELLVAVPTHIVVRRRHECCAGLATGTGICLGVAVMLVSFGPSVLLLYYRRRKQILPKAGR